MTRTFAAGTLVGYAACVFGWLVWGTVVCVGCATAWVLADGEGE